MTVSSSYPAFINRVRKRSVLDLTISCLRSAGRRSIFVTTITQYRTNIQHEYHRRIRWSAANATLYKCDRACQLYRSLSCSSSSIQLLYRYTVYTRARDKRRDKQYLAGHCTTGQSPSTDLNSLAASLFEVTAAKNTHRHTAHC